MAVEKPSPTVMFWLPAPVTAMPGPGRLVDEPDELAVRSLNTCMPTTSADEISGVTGRFQATFPSSVRTRDCDSLTLRDPSMLFSVYSSMSYRHREKAKLRRLATSQPAVTSTFSSLLGVYVAL